MAKNKGKPENLRTPTTEEARRIGSAGGKKSVAVRRERKLLSQIYRDLLAKEFKVKRTDEDGQEVDVKFTIDDVVAEVMQRKDAASVAMLAEMRKATEGDKTELSGTLAPPTFNLVLQRDNNPTA